MTGPDTSSDRPTCVLLLAYRTVSGVNGPLVILDNVKVNSISGEKCDINGIQFCCYGWS